MFTVDVKQQYNDLCCVSAYSVPKSYGEACTGADTCATTLSCTGGTCQCTNSAHTYKASIELCTDKAVFSEACTGVSDCYATTSK